ncbi:hypothetical protein [uncultured Schumannella sp.]|uniref:hypothetical protein n=1 Tax=uncultured Schumannella sp. TaxID=1195956 RepID=UPI0025FEA716|nr:hypothetical protein [uncultured Schumannella sp.]
MRIASPGPAAALGAAVALALSLSLAACAPDPAPITLPPQPTSTPLFASDEEALAAAEEVYSSYVRASNLLAQSGWLDYSDLAEVTTPELMAEIRSYSDGQSETGSRQVGDTQSFVHSLQSFRQNGDTAVVTVYVCIDLSDARLISAEGLDITPDGRVDMLPSVVELVATEDQSLRVNEDDKWDGPLSC